MAIVRLTATGLPLLHPFPQAEDVLPFERYECRNVFEAMHTAMCCTVVQSGQVQLATAKKRSHTEGVYHQQSERALICGQVHFALF